MTVVMALALFDSCVVSLRISCRRLVGQELSLGVPRGIGAWMTKDYVVRKVLIIYLPWANLYGLCPRVRVISWRYRLCWLAGSRLNLVRMLNLLALTVRRTVVYYSM